MAYRGILSNFFEEQRTENHPQYLSGLSRALFPTTFLEIAVYKHLESLSAARVHKSLIYIGNLARHSFSLFDRNKTQPQTSKTSEQRLAYH